MSKLKFTITMSVDGYVAGPRQSLENPLGEDGMSLHEWRLPPRPSERCTGGDGGEKGLDDEVLAAGPQRRRHHHGPDMFGPIRRLGRREMARSGGRGPALPHPGVRPHHHPREPWRCRAARPSTSSPTGSSRRSPRPGTT